MHEFRRCDDTESQTNFIDFLKQKQKFQLDRKKTQNHQTQRQTFFPKFATNQFNQRILTSQTQNCSKPIQTQFPKGPINIRTRPSQKNFPPNSQSVWKTEFQTYPDVYNKQYYV